MRRFGWPFCRIGAKQLSALKPQLDANNVRLIGIGLEELGLEDFQKGGYFTGGRYCTIYSHFQVGWFMVFNATFNNISVLFVEEPGVSGENDEKL